MAFKKLLWTLKRHPFLYLTRFRLLSKNSSIEDIENSKLNYNFKNLKKDLPAIFHEINKKIFETDDLRNDFEKVTFLCVWLNDNIKGGRGLSEPSDKALDTMLKGKGGVCSDMVQIFNNFCVLNDLKVREWGTTSAPFKRSNGGHSFNEVYIEELQKWILIDPFWGGMFCDQDQKPLSVVEMYQLLRSNKIVNYQSILSENTIVKARINKSYFNPDNIPFLIYNYKNKTYDKYLKWGRPYMPVFVIHFMVFITGNSYFYRFPLDDYKKIFS